MFPWSGIVAAGRRCSAFSQAARHVTPRARLVGLRAGLVPRRVRDRVAGEHQVPPLHPAGAAGAGDPGRPVPRRPVARAARAARAGRCCSSAVPLTFLCGRDLAAFPPRLLWLFNYDYVNVPTAGVPGRPAPSTSTATRIGVQILVVRDCAATLARSAVTRAGARATAERGSPTATRPPSTAATPALASRSGSIPVATAGRRRAVGSRRSAPAPHAARRTAGSSSALAGAALFLLVLHLGGGPARPTHARAPTRRPARLVGAVGVRVDRLRPRQGAHRAVAALEPEARDRVLLRSARAPEEPLIAWQLYWRGENFYTQERDLRSPQRRRRTRPSSSAITTPRRCRPTSRRHGGRRVFFIVERAASSRCAASCPRPRGRRSSRSTRPTTRSTWPSPRCRPATRPRPAPAPAPDEKHSTPPENPAR